MASSGVTTGTPAALYAPGGIKGPTTVAGSLTVDGSLTASDGVNEIQLAGQTIKAYSVATGAETGLITGGEVVVTSTGGVGGSLELSAGTNNVKSITAYNSTGAPDNLYLQTQTPPAAVITGGDLVLGSGGTPTGDLAAATVSGPAFTPTAVPPAGAYLNFGYIQLGTLLLQWGSVDDNSSNTAVIFPIPFATGTLPSVQLTAAGQFLLVGSGQTAFYVNAITNTAVDVEMVTPSGDSEYNWFAIGFGTAPA